MLLDRKTVFLVIFFLEVRQSNKGHLFPPCCLTPPSLPLWPHSVAYVSDLSTVPSKSEEKKKIFDTVIQQNGAKTMCGLRICSWFQNFDSAETSIAHSTRQCVADLNPLQSFFSDVTWKVWHACTVLTLLCAFHPHFDSLEKLKGWSTDALLGPQTHRPLCVVVNAVVL